MEAITQAVKLASQLLDRRERRWLGNQQKPHPFRVEAAARILKGEPEKLRKAAQ